MSKKILIIEDDNFLMDLISKKLKSEIYSILGAAESVEAFKLLESNKPDLILLDLLLPGIDGFEILKKVRQTEETKNIPVIVFSNLSEEKDIKKAQDLGITAFMVKANFTLDELLEKIKETLE
jgi:two-component system alkaline phosphatase synthesis response regulator PhoP